MSEFCSHKLRNLLLPCIRYIYCQRNNILIHRPCISFPFYKPNWNNWSYRSIFQLLEFHRSLNSLIRNNFLHIFCKYRFHCKSNICWWNYWIYNFLMYQHNIMWDTMSKIQCSNQVVHSMECLWIHNQILRHQLFSFYSILVNKFCSLLVN